MKTSFFLVVLTFISLFQFTHSQCVVTGITVTPAASDVTLTYIPDTGNCAGFTTPFDSTVDSSGNIAIQCDDTCVFQLTSASPGATINTASATAPGCTVDLTTTIPDFTTNTPDCFGDCICSPTGTFTTWISVSNTSATVPSTDCTAVACTPFIDFAGCGFGGPEIVDADNCNYATEFTTLTACQSCPSGFPAPINLYNVFLWGDLNVGPYCTDIEGRAAVGGDMNWCSSVGSQIAGPDTNNMDCLDLIDLDCFYPWALVVGGTANVQGAVYGGDAYAGFWVQPKQLANQNIGRSKKNNETKIENVDLPDFQCLALSPPETTDPIDFEGLETAFQAASGYYNQLSNAPQTGTVSSVGQVIRLRGSGTTGTEVFRTTCASINQNTRRIEISNINPNVNTIIINVYCFLYGNDWELQNIDMSALLPFQNKVIWTVDSDIVNINAVGFIGSLIAPFADVTGSNGNILGQLVANSFSGSFQFNDDPFEGCPTLPPPTSFMDKSESAKQARERFKAAKLRKQQSQPKKQKVLELPKAILPKITDSKPNPTSDASTTSTKSLFLLVTVCVQIFVLMFS